MEEKTYAEPKVKYDFSRVQDDVFAVEGMKQGRNEAGIVDEGYVYRWANVSPGQEIRHEQLNNCYWEKVDDADTRAKAGGHDEGGFVNLKKNNEEYRLYKRPVKAHEAHRKFKNSNRIQAVKSENTTKTPYGSKQLWSLKQDPKPFGRKKKMR